MAWSGAAQSSWLGSYECCGHSPGCTLSATCESGHSKSQSQGRHVHWAEIGPGKDGTLRTGWGSGSRPVRSSHTSAGGTPLGSAVGRALLLDYTFLSTPVLGDVIHRGGQDPHTNLIAWKTLIKGERHLINTPHPQKI